MKSPGLNFVNFKIQRIQIRRKYEIFSVTNTRQKNRRGSCNLANLTATRASSRDAPEGEKTSKRTSPSLSTENVSEREKS